MKQLLKNWKRKRDLKKIYKQISLYRSQVPEWHSEPSAQGNIIWIHSGIFKDHGFVIHNVESVGSDLTIDYTLVNEDMNALESSKESNDLISRIILLLIMEFVRETLED